MWEEAAAAARAAVSGGVGGRGVLHGTCECDSHRPTHNSVVLHYFSLYTTGYSVFMDIYLFFFITDILQYSEWKFWVIIMRWLMLL